MFVLLLTSPLLGDRVAATRHHLFQIGDPVIVEGSSDVFIVADVFRDDKADAFRIVSRFAPVVWGVEPYFPQIGGEDV